MRAILIVAAILFAAQASPAARQTDLDQLMAQVLEKRDENWRKLQQYVLEERESFDLNGPGRQRLYGFRREHAWFMRDGIFVRSPVRADGVEVSESDRRKAEADWVRREQARSRRERERAKAESGEQVQGADEPVGPEPPATQTGPMAASAGALAVEPAFVSHAYFLRFKFEEGRYALAGRETWDGREVLRIEYYPSLLFREGRSRPNRRVRERDEAIEEKMNKVSLVTLWVDQEARQILQYTFDDIDMDFLPGRSLVRVDDMKASMRMGQPFEGVWLPQSVEMHFRMTLATGRLDATYQVAYHDYREADVQTRVQGAEAPPAEVRGVVRDAAVQGNTPNRGAQAGTVARVVRVRVHGNHTTPAGDVLAIAGDVVGQVASEVLVERVRTRLVESGRFAGVTVDRRLPALDDPSKVLLVIVVDEHAGVAADDLVPGTWKRLTASGMWLPVLGYDEGYGFTYGARFGFVNPLGPRSRISVPLTWGGERRAEVEVERGFESRSIARVMGAAGVTRRENPFYDVADTRLEARARVESAPLEWLRLGAGVGLADIGFGELDDRLTSVGGDVAIDTRVDPAFPRNAVFGRVGVERLAFDRGVSPDGADASGSSSVRLSFNGSGYLGVFRQVVLAVRAQSIVSSEPLPLFEQSLLGGAASLRGSDVGTRAGDNLAAGSIEIRMPLTSPIGLARLGIKVFADAATVYASGLSLGDQSFSRGYGAGLFVHATVFRLGMDVGWPEQGGGPNLHVQMGLTLGR